MNMPRIQPLCLALACALAGCATVEAPTRVAVPAPAAWDEPAPAGAAVSASWWRSFGSPQLEALVAEALAGSSDLRIGAERVRQAEIALGVAGAARLPSISAGIDTAAGRTDEQGSSAVTRKSAGASLSVGYEVDLWGRIAAGVRSGEATLAATRYDLDALRLSLTASVADTYFLLLATREQLAVAQDNLALAERVLKIVDARHRNGVASALDLSQQTRTVLAQRSALLPLEVQVRQTASALALLLGRVPQGYNVGAEPLYGLAVPQIAPGLPSTLLARRPDIAAAEAGLAAADADVAAARAALLPSISLSASAGASSAALVSLANPTTSAALGLALAQTLFDGGQRQAGVDVAVSQRRVLVETYAAAARSAFKEVDDALGNANQSARQETAQAAVIAEAQRSLRLAELRYREGADDLLAVLDAQSTLFSAQNAQVQLRQARLQAALDLFKALGGGWEAPSAATPVASTTPVR